MIAILTPAKTLTTRAISNTIESTRPRLREEIETLSTRVASFSKSQLKKILKVSDKIVNLNFERFKTFKDAERRPCALYFDGAAHRGLNAWTFSDVERRSAQRRVRIVSGLYGILRPYDAIAAYRLEMGTKMLDGSTLYSFWGDKITDNLLYDLKEVAKTSPGVIVNCCSKEYAKAINFKRLESSEDVVVIHCEFPGPSVYAKRARGMMCRYIAINAINDAEALKSFVGYEEDAHYTYDHSASTKKKGNTMVFLRRAGPPPPVAKRKKRK